MNPSQGMPSGPDGSSLPGLLARLKSPTEKDWQRLMTLYGPVVLYWCRLHGLQSDRTTDVFAAVFRAVAVGIAEFDTQLANSTFRNWMRIITQGILDDALGNGRTNPPLADTPSTDEGGLTSNVPEAASQQRPSSAEEMLLLRQAVEMVRPEFDAATFDAFTQTVLDRQSITAVAERLSLPTLDVSKARSLVLRRLREEFDTLLD